MEILLVGCISESSFNTVHGPLITQGVHVQQLLVFLLLHTEKHTAPPA